VIILDGAPGGVAACAIGRVLDAAQHARIVITSPDDRREEP